MNEKFHHTLPDGSEIVLPKYKHVPAGIARKARNDSVGNQMWTFLEHLCTPEDLARLDDLTVEDFAILIDAWQKDSKVQPGESKPSSR
jgi:hypothetical protein